MQRKEIIDRLSEAHQQLLYLASRGSDGAGRLALADIARCIEALKAENPQPRAADPRPRPTTGKEAEAAGAQWYRDVTEGDEKK